jgi:homoserine kinase
VIRDHVRVVGQGYDGVGAALEAENEELSVQYQSQVIELSRTIGRHSVHVLIYKAMKQINKQYAQPSI